MHRVRRSRTARSSGPVELALGWSLILLATLGPVYTLRFHLGGFLGPWEDDTWVRAVFMTLYVVTTCALVRAGVRGELRRPSWRAASLAALGVWSLASIAWSVAPAVTQWRSVLFCGSILAGAYLGLRFSVRALTALTGTACLTGVLAGIAMVLLRPSEGIMQRQGDYWAGIYFNRNSFAPVCAVAMLSLAVIAVAEAGRIRVLAALGAVVAAGALVMTQSRTALAGVAVCLIATGLATAVRVARRRDVPARVVGLVATAIVAVALVASFLLFHRALAAAGVDPTLDNRTPLWNFVRMEIGLRRFRGYGFYAYWSDPTSVTKSIGWLNWAPPTAHNGFLETGLGLGIPAMVLLIVTTLSTVVDSARRVWRESSVYGVWPLLIVLYFVFADLTESFVLPNQFLWILFVAMAVVPLGAALRSDRSQRAPRDLTVRAR